MKDFACRHEGRVRRRTRGASTGHRVTHNGLKMPDACGPDDQRRRGRLTACALALAVAAGLSAGCAASAPSAADLTVREAMSTSKPMPANPSRSGRVDTPPGARATAEAMAAAVRADAAQMLKLPDATMLSVAVEAVTWSDGSLGCPQPGMMYTQALVPGWRAVVGDGQRQWVYHASRGGSWMLCPAGRALAPLPGEATR